MDEGAAAMRLVGNDFLALPELLRRAGYSTYSAHGNFPAFWNRSVMHPKYGIEKMLFHDVLGDGEQFGFGLSDKVFVERLVPYLARSKKPFFAFAITVSSHHPYDMLPPWLKTLDVGPLQGSMLGDYLEAQHYTDSALQHLFELLDQQGLLKSTLVVIYGDHDAGLADTPEYEQLLGIDQMSAPEAIRFDRVPLFVRLPDESLHGIEPRLGGQIDIAPTVLHLLGIQQPPCYVGVPLLGKGDVPAVSPMGAAAEESRVWIGSGNDDHGTCLDRATLQPIDSAQCDGIARESGAELAASKWAIEHNALRELGCQVR
jgi:phosphoglycerol transferase MdoB-like AlkP superfamily enzyme